MTTPNPQRTLEERVAQMEASLRKLTAEFDEFKRGVVRHEQTDEQVKDEMFEVTHGG